MKEILSSSRFFNQRVSPVQPWTPNQLDPRVPRWKRLGRLILRGCNRALDLWDRSEIGHRGHYSVERLLALGDYCERTSPTRALAVCLLGPFPALLVTLGIEWIPLRDPADGWRANGAFWLRLALSNFVISLGGVIQMKPVLVPDVITIKRALAIAAATSCCYVLSCLAVASLWVFPTPFGIVFNVGPYVLQFLFFVYLTIGPRVWATTPALRQQIRKHLPLVAAEGSLVLIYPAYSVIFRQLSSNHQALFIFLLPVIKLVMKQTITYISADLDECVATVVVFSVDVFNMLYVSICIQTSTSPLTIPFVFAGDAIPIAVAIRTIYLQTKFSPHRRHSDPLASIKPKRCPNYLKELPARVREAFQARRGTQTLTIRVQAPIALPVSDKSRKLLDELVHLQQEGERVAAATASTSAPLSLVAIIRHCPIKAIVETPQAQGNQSNIRQRHATLRATARNLLLLNRSSRALIRPTDGQRKERPFAFPAPRRTSVDAGVPFHLGSFAGQSFRRVGSQANNLEHAVQEALQALFHSEYIVLIEYIECVMPLLYAVYLGVLVHLPNVIFYAHAHALTPNKLSATLLTLTLYGSLELVSLASVHVLLKRRLGFSPIYQLAFVLECHAATVQGHLLVWIVYILPFTLLHFDGKVMGFNQFMQVAPIPQSPEQQRRPPQTSDLVRHNDRREETTTCSCAKQAIDLGLCLKSMSQRLQVSQRGMYSVERLQALESYCVSTSPLRVFAVCVLTPLPALLVVVLLECLPLRDPAEGWQANYMLWLRLFISSVIILKGITVQVKESAEDSQLSLMRCLGISTTASTFYIASVIAIASQWVFPIPFGVIVAIPPHFIVYVGCLLLGIGRQAFRTAPDLGHQLYLQLFVLGAQGLLIIIYPAFSALYLGVTPSRRVGLVLVLPTTKLIMKNVVAWASSHLEDYVPLIVVFSVEVFNTLYVAVCMQASNSGAATVLLISLDVALEARSYSSCTKRRQSVQSDSTTAEQIQQAQFVDNALKLLFHCEYRVLNKYTKCVTPLLYGTYLTILCQLPNREYYPQVRAMKPGRLESTLVKFGLYVALELLFFVAMHTLLKRRLGVAPLYQLAFVLETQILQVQSRLFVWIVFILQFTLQHFGVDFTFRFEWLRQNVK